MPYQIIRNDIFNQDSEIVEDNIESHKEAMRLLNEYTLIEPGMYTIKEVK